MSVRLIFKREKKKMEKKSEIEFKMSYKKKNVYII